MSVYKSINAVQAELTKIGITKDGRNNQGAGYNFRGIDQVYNTLSPLLSKHGLCILPRVIKSEQTERTSSKGGVLIYSYVTMEFDLVCAEDGSKHTICTVGEAFDSGDKSMNKAMSAAYKYAAFQAFAIPTEGDNDADAHTHVVEPKKLVHRPTSGAQVPEDEKPFLQDLANDLINVIKEQRKLTDGMAMLHAAGLEPEQKIYLWSLLPSDVRSQIKTAEKTPI
jgi:hypothetical protein